MRRNPLELWRTALLPGLDQCAHWRAEHELPLVLFSIGADGR